MSRLFLFLIALILANVSLSNEYDVNADTISNEVYIFHKERDSLLHDITDIVLKHDPNLETFVGQYYKLTANRNGRIKRISPIIKSDSALKIRQDLRRYFLSLKYIRCTICEERSFDVAYYEIVVFPTYDKLNPKLKTVGIVISFYFAE